MTTIGLIGAGHIGSQIARLAVANDYDVVISNSRGPETLSALVAELGPRARAATAVDAAKAGDIVVVTVPLKNYRAVPVEPLEGKIVIDTNNYYPNATATSLSSTMSRPRPPSSCRRICQPRRSSKPSTTSTPQQLTTRRPAGRYGESSRVGDCRRRSRGQSYGHSSARPVRLRHRGCRPVEGGVAHPARYARLRSAADSGGAAQGPRRGEAVRGTALRHTLEGRRQKADYRRPYWGSPLVGVARAYRLPLRSA